MESESNGRAARARALRGRQPLAPPDVLLIGRLGERPVALPGASVERVLQMVALTPVPDLPPPVVGVINIQGSVLAVVDPRPSLDIPTAPWRLEQRLVLVRAATRYALWLDAAERIVRVAPEALQPVTSGAVMALAPLLARLDGEVIPVLSPSAFDPGPILVSAGERAG